MRRLSTGLLAAAIVLLPVLSAAAHGDEALGSPVPDQELVVTGHERPEPALHVEALSGTIELYCLGCLLDNRVPARASDPGSAARPKTQVHSGQAPLAAPRPAELPAYRSPRAPPAP